jgi:DNA polymerase-3 subunit delta'
MSWNMIGHDWAVNLLKTNIRNGHLPHSYLITGPQRVGRRSLAIRLAQAVNCDKASEPGEICATCRPCEKIGQMQHPDFHVVQAQENRGTLKVDQIRELQHKLSLTPYEANYRIALLLRFEEAHNSAANALLKTLEEPPRHVILIITADSSESLPATIVSRCQVIHLRSVPTDTITRGLVSGWNLSQDDASHYAHICGGRPGLAITLHQNLEISNQRTTWLDEHLDLLSANRVDRFAYAEQLVKKVNQGESKESLLNKLELWQSLWRDIYLSGIQPDSEIINIDKSPEIKRISTQVDTASAIKTIKILQKTVELILKNANLRLTLEILMLDLPHQEGVPLTRV